MIGAPSYGHAALTRHQPSNNEWTPQQRRGDRSQQGTAATDIFKDVADRYKKLEPVKDALGKLDKSTPLQTFENAAVLSRVVIMTERGETHN